MNTTWQCPKCGAPLESTSLLLVTCSYCGTKVIVPGFLRREEKPPENQVSQPADWPEPSPAPAPPTPQPADLQDELRNLLQQGQKIQAIKRYREVYRSGLKEAKEAVEAFEAGAGLSIPPQPQPQEIKPAQGEVIQEIIRIGLAGNKIEAIKRYRQHFDVGLAEAKLVVEQLLADTQKDPAWAAQIAQAELAKGRKANSSTAAQSTCLITAFMPFFLIAGAILALIVIFNLIFTGKPF